MSRTDKERVLTFQAAICLSLSLVEYAIPRPLPFVKLGLANLPLIVTLSFWDWRDFLLLALLKAVSSALAGGTLFSPVFPVVLAGSLSSALVMKGTKTVLKGNVSPIGVSVLGSLASNLSQLLLSSLLVYGPAVWRLAPLVLALGLATGLVLGLLAIWLEKEQLDGLLREGGGLQTNEPNTKDKRLPFWLLAFSLVFVACTSRLSSLAAAWLLLLCAQKTSGRKIRLLPSLFLILALLILSVCTPSGKVLCSFGRIVFTEGALEEAAGRGLKICGMMAASQAMVGYIPPLKGSFFRLLGDTLATFGSFHLPRGKGNLKDKIRQTLTPEEGRRKTPRKHYPALVSLFSLLACLVCVIPL